MTRRAWLSMASASACAAAALPGRVVWARDDTVGRVEDRVSRIIREYEQQGFHRTGTTVDGLSGDWLYGEVRRVGLAPVREPFSLGRVDLGTNALIAADRRIEGLPLFDAAFTDSDGIRGRLGPLQSGAAVGLADTAPNAAASGPLGDARRANRHRAIVCVTRGGRPGLCPSNADSFLRPFGPPVLQVSSEQAAWLSEQAHRGTEVQLIAQVTRTAASAVNVTATIEGTDPALPPVVISTPRSGWYWCASERGGGIACWLETMRALRTARPSRSVIFVAFSGHELGYLGMHGFVDRRPGIVSRAAAWIHFGANIGAATDPGNRIAVSDDELGETVRRAMAASGLAIDQQIPRGTKPGGEAAVVHDGGGRYVAVTGRNALFHNPDDRGPLAVDPVTIARFSTAFTTVARALAGRPRRPARG